MSPARLHLRRAARDDIAAAVEFLAAHSRIAAERFVEQTWEALERLCAFPGIGTQHDFGPPVGVARRWAVSGFPYLLFYRVEVSDGEVVDVLRVLHGLRDIPAILAQDI